MAQIPGAFLGDESGRIITDEAGRWLVLWFVESPECTTTNIVELDTQTNILELATQTNVLKLDTQTNVLELARQTNVLKLDTTTNVGCG